jgi:hypothetical protein
MLHSMSSSSAQAATARSPAAALRELSKTASSLQQLTDELAAAPRAKLKKALLESASGSSSLLAALEKAEARFAEIRQIALGNEAPSRKEAAGATPMAKLRAQANQGLRKLVEEGVLMGRGAFQDERTITRQALSKAQQERRLFHVEVDGEKYFPSFFVDSRYDRAKLEAVSKALGELPGATKLHFFLHKRGSLAGTTPLEAIASGNYQKVLNAAEALRIG